MIHCFSIVCLLNLYRSTIFLREFTDSGHGGQTKDLDGDEADGFDEGTMTFPSRRFCVCILTGFKTT